MLSVPARAQLQKHLMADEGLRLSAYQDSLGYWTIGIGKMIDARKGGGISALEAYDLLEHDIDRAYIGLVGRYPWFQDLDEVRQSVLINLAFNMGHETLRTFTHTLAAFARKDWPAAANGLQQSRWYTQVQKARSARLIQMTLTGVWP